MRTPAAIAEELKALSETMDRFEDEAALRPGAKLMRRSLAERQEQLLQELKLASLGRERPSLTFLLEGYPTLQQSMSVRLAASLLSYLQEIVSSAGQALTGHPTTRGSIPREVLRSTDLRLAGVAFGSFGFVLEGPPSIIQEQLFGPPEPSLTEQVLERVVDTIEASVKSEEDFLSNLAQLGERFSGNLSRFADLLAESEGDAEFIVEGPLMDRRVFEASSSDFTGLRSSLEDIDTDTEFEAMTGKLAGAMTISGRFEFERDDGVVLRGRVDPNMRDKLPDYFVQQCTARIEVTRTTLRKTGKAAYSYRLLDVYDA